VPGWQCRAGDSIRSAITPLGLGWFSYVLADDAEVVERVGEIGMPVTDLPLLQRGRLTQVLLR
jgi:hypothetical protein